MIGNLKKHIFAGGKVSEDESGTYLLELPLLEKEVYGLAQMDNYMHLHRSRFPHTAPISLTLDARVSTRDMPGTWGFGFWNDPFSYGFSAGGMKRILPVLPNAAWFFYGSPTNHLSLRDDLPSKGFHAKTFRSPLIPSIFSLLALPGIPMLFCPPISRLFRRFARVLVHEDGSAIDLDVREWHTYHLSWQIENVIFSIDGQLIMKAPISPNGNLGLVIWIDNQFFRFDDKGRIGFGYLPTKTKQSLSIRNISLARH